MHLLIWHNHRPKSGNCKTTMMAMISPALESFPESLSTLKVQTRIWHIHDCQGQIPAFAFR